MFYHIFYKGLAIIGYIIGLIFLIIGLPIYILIKTIMVFIILTKDEYVGAFNHIISQYKKLKVLMPASFRKDVTPYLSWEKIKDAIFYTWF